MLRSFKTTLFPIKLQKKPTLVQVQTGILQGIRGDDQQNAGCGESGGTADVRSSFPTKSLGEAHFFPKLPHHSEQRDEDASVLDCNCTPRLLPTRRAFRGRCYL